MEPLMKNLITCLFLFITIASFAQTIDKLDRNNGLLGIYLLADIDTVPDFISIFKDTDINNQKYEFAMLGSQYTYNGTRYRNFGNVGINKIFLTTDPDKGLITEIKIVCEFDSSVLSTIVNMYGKPNVPSKLMVIEDKKAERAVTWWQGKNVRLRFTAKKYYKKKDSDESETPDYMYLFITSLEADQLKDR
jgi:hypothetical protein